MRTGQGKGEVGWVEEMPDGGSNGARSARARSLHGCVLAGGAALLASSMVPRGTTVVERYFSTYWKPPLKPPKILLNLSST